MCKYVYWQGYLQRRIKYIVLKENISELLVEEKVCNHWILFKDHWLTIQKKYSAFVSDKLCILKI